MFRLLPLIAVTFGLSHPAAANAPEEVTTLDLGGAVLVRPAYAGSDQYLTNLLPFIAFDNLYGIDMRGLALSAPLIEKGTGFGPGTWSLEAGPRVGFDFGRQSSDSPTLEGLENISPSLLLGGYARANFGVIGFDVTAGQDIIDGHGGFNADFSVGTRYPGDGWFIQPLLTLSWADQNFTQEIYGISADQTLTSVLPQFDVGSGFHQASATILGGFDVDENWSLTAVVSYREALGDYRDSPIISAEDGSAAGVFATIGISRRFNF